MKKVTLTFAAIVLMFAACKTTKPTETSTATAKPKPDCTSVKVSYDDIKSIIESNCLNCHGKRGAGGYDFTNTDDVHRAGKSGDLLGTIKWQKGYPAMPAKAAQLDAATITKIECWINGGMN